MSMESKLPHNIPKAASYDSRTLGANRERPESPRRLTLSIG